MKALLVDITMRVPPLTSHDMGGSRTLVKWGGGGWLWEFFEIGVANREVRVQVMFIYNNCTI